MANKITQIVPGTTNALSAATYINEAAIYDDVLSLSGNLAETVTGLKTFSDGIVSSYRIFNGNQQAFLSLDTVSLYYAINGGSNVYEIYHQGNLNTFDYVNITTNQNISGIKTFNDDIVANSTINRGTHELNVSGLTYSPDNGTTIYDVYHTGNFNVPGVEGDIMINKNGTLGVASEPFNWDDNNYVLEIPEFSTLQFGSSATKPSLFGRNDRMFFDIGSSTIIDMDAFSVSITPSSDINLSVGSANLSVVNDFVGITGASRVSLGSGNVGIGTTNPTQKLQVLNTLNASDRAAYLDNPQSSTSFSSTFGSLYIVNSNQTNNNYARFDFGDGDNPASASVSAKLIHHVNNYADLEFRTRGSDGFNERLTILSEGNVGIGQTAPSEKLHISNGNLLVENTGIAANLIFNRTDGKAIGILAGSSSNILKYDSSGSFSISKDTKSNILAGSGPGTVIMTFATNDRVGLGTEVPSSKLHINGGTGSLSTGLVFGDGDTGFYESADDSLRVSINNSALGTFNNLAFIYGSASVWSRSASATLPVFVPNTNDSDTGIGRAGDNQLSLIAGGVEGIRVNNSSVDLNGTVNVDSNIINGTHELNVNGLTYSPDNGTNTYNIYHSGLNKDNGLISITSNTITLDLGNNISYTAILRIDGFISSALQITVTNSSNIRDFKILINDAFGDLQDGIIFVNLPSFFYPFGQSGWSGSSIPKYIGTRATFSVESSVYDNGNDWYLNAVQY